MAIYRYSVSWKKCGYIEEKEEWEEEVKLYLIIVRYSNKDIMKNLPGIKFSLWNLFLFQIKLKYYFLRFKAYQHQILYKNYIFRNLFSIDRVKIKVEFYKIRNAKTYIIFMADLYSTKSGYFSS